MSTTIEEYGYVFPYEKIKIPFQERRNKVRWPNNNILAAHIYVALEWWGKDLLPGDGEVLNIGGLSEKEGYNFDVGIWRALELLDKHQLKATFFTSGAGAERYPNVIRDIKQRGHEIAAHAYYQSRRVAAMDPDEEREDKEKTTAILESVCGERPRGWSGPAAGCSERSFELLVELGYEWTGDLMDDDLPYGLKVGDKILVVIPHRTQTTNDFSFYEGRRGFLTLPKALRSSREAVRFFQDTFEDYYETARLEEPQSLTFGIHPFSSCTPDRIRALDKMIALMKGYPGVWFATSGELAEWWRNNYL